MTKVFVSVDQVWVAEATYQTVLLEVLRERGISVYKSMPGKSSVGCRGKMVLLEDVAAGLIEARV